MATPILKLITEYCAVYVDDVRLNELLDSDQPLYARRMWGYLLPAIPLFNLPAEMPMYLVGDTATPKLIPPQYADTTYTVTEDIESKTVLSLGAEYAGYELCGCRLRQENAVTGTVALTPLAVDYDGESGDVTVAATEPIPSGSKLEFDFYTDGYFVEDLSRDVLNILGLCFAVVWQTRFNNDWLSNVSKVEDKSFSEQNRANKMNADTARLKELRADLAAEMRRYEQNIYYRTAVGANNRIKIN